MIARMTVALLLLLPALLIGCGYLALVLPAREQWMVCESLREKGNLLTGTAVANETLQSWACQLVSKEEWARDPYFLIANNSFSDADAFDIVRFSIVHIGIERSLVTDAGVHSILSMGSL